MSKTGRHLTYLERCQIFAFLKTNHSISTIAIILNRHKSVVYREIKRHSFKRKYCPDRAQRRAMHCKRAASSVPRKLTFATRQLITREVFMTELSPMQLAGRLKAEGVFISHQTLYNFIHQDKAKGGALYKHLRRKLKKYNRRAGKTAGRGLIPNRVGIESRPAIVEKKERFGDFELDTIIGAQHNGAIVSMVDRATKYTYLSLLEKKSEVLVTEAIVIKLANITQRNLVKTLTSDNGKEFAGHKKIAESTGGSFFFANPYCSWERGLNEHTNGLVRQYFPKGTDFTKLTKSAVAQVEFKLNSRPRKILNFKTPAEAFYALNGFFESVAFPT
jgi:IS30 family transposase